jgi:hypothetical protein
VALYAADAKKANDNFIDTGNFEQGGSAAPAFL